MFLSDVGDGWATGNGNSDAGTANMNINRIFFYEN